MLISSDLQRHADWLAELSELGFDDLYLHHVGQDLRPFIAALGFPQSELVDNRFTRRFVSTPERGAQAIVDAGLGSKSER